MTKRFSYFLPVLMFGATFHATAQRVNAQQADEVPRETVEDMQEFARSVGAKTITIEPPLLDPGAGGLRFLGVQPLPSGVANPAFGALWSAREKPIERRSVGAVVDTQTGRRFRFAALSSADPGHLGSPFWMLGGKKLVLPFGAFAEYDGFFLYAFSPGTRKIERIFSQSITEEELAPSPDGRFLAFCSLAPAPQGVANRRASFRALRIWDAQTGAVSEVARDPFAYRSYRWDGDRLVYSVTRVLNGVAQPVSYAYSPRTRKSELVGRGMWAPVLSPDGKWRLFAGPLRRGEAFSEANAAYKLQNLQSGAIQILPNTALGKMQGARRLLWSKDSRFVFSVHGDFTTNKRRLFALDVESGKSQSWPVERPSNRVEPLQSNDGTQLFLLIEGDASKSTAANEFYDRFFEIVRFDVGSANWTTLQKRAPILDIRPVSIKVKF